MANYGWSIHVVDDYGNIQSLRTVSQVDRYLISTNTYGGYDFPAGNKIDAEI